MARIIMSVLFITALFFMFSLLNKNTPELRSLLPDTSKVAGAENTAFKWVASESNAADGTKSLDLALLASKPAGTRTTLHLTCFAGNAYAYLYPVPDANEVKKLALNGNAVKFKVDQDRVFIVNPAALELSQELTNIPLLNVQLTYADTTEKLRFESAGLALYQPYMVTDCPGTAVAQAKN
jgi:hypothetical protein